MKPKQIDMKKFYLLQNPLTQQSQQTKGFLVGNQIIIINLDKNTVLPETNDILDDELSKRIYSNFCDDLHYGKQFNLNPKQRIPSALAKPPQPEQKKKDKQYQDSDEISNLAGKLTNLELLCANQKEELKEQVKDTVIAQLTSQINTYKELLSPDQINYKEKLQKENAQIEEEINQICKFLKEYGLQWVGSGERKETKEQKETEQLRNQFEISEQIREDKPFIQYKIPREIDMNIITRRIAELNQIIISETGTQVAQKIDGAIRLKGMEQLIIGFYKDGIAMKGFKFFPYGSKDAYKILLDLLDGFFPIKYPDGVYLKVLDRVEQLYDNQAIDKKGIKNLNTIDEDELRPLGKNEFLNKFPKVVIKDGKIIEVRSEIEKKLGQNNNKEDDQIMGQIINIPTDWSRKLEQNLLNNEETKRSTKLKILIEENHKELIIDIDSKQSINELLQIIKPYCDLTKYNLIQKFPFKLFKSDNKNSLFDEGLFPNAALMMQKK